MLFADWRLLLGVCCCVLCVLSVACCVLLLVGIFGGCCCVLVLACRLLCAVHSVLFGV